MLQKKGLRASLISYVWITIRKFKMLFKMAICRDHGNDYFY